ncbi:MAG: ATP-binding protein [Synechococcales bacterium]|nr:ATP-binding protein [Synechococcales bacterium]
MPLSAMQPNPFLPHQLIGRQTVLDQVSQIFAQDEDLLVTGVPGMGRRTLIRAAARQCGARVIEIDCLRATHYQRFLELLAEGIIQTFSSAAELSFIQTWSQAYPLILETSQTGPAKLVWEFAKEQEWQLFQALISLPQTLAEWLDCRVVLMVQNFPHLRSWDRQGKWEHYLQQEIQQQTRVSYVIIATVVEQWKASIPLQEIFLPPLPGAELATWLVEAMAIAGLTLEPSAISLFLSYVQGHFGTAIALARRLWLDDLAGRDSKTTPPSLQPLSLVRSHQVYRSASTLVEDLSLTFESLILLLPNTQVRVLESLALDPTESPHAKDYIKKHHLSRGGTLQGALASLEQKGLIYGAEQNYRLALPLLGFWLKHRLS